jgi:hypothetical protein
LIGAERAPSLQDYAEIRYLDPSACRFERGEGGFLKLKIGESEEYARVDLSRAFPLSNQDSYVSVRDAEGKEIGIIESLRGFSEPVRALLAEELDRRYFTPVVQRVRSIKEEFGYSYWEVETSAGPRRFTVRGGHGSLIPLSETRILVVDVDGNRFEIEDYTRLGSKHSRLVESLL